MPGLGCLKRNSLVNAFACWLVLAMAPTFAFCQQKSIRFLLSETDALAARLAAVETASTSISIATFRIRDDNTGGQLLSALLAAADRGVRVRLLVDAHANSINLPKPLMRYLTERGVSIRERPFDARSKLEIGRPRLHDKLFVVDSSTVILGGRNMEEKYFGLGSRNYIDFDVIAHGETACDAERYFEERWCETSSATPRLSGPERAKMLKGQDHAEWNQLSYDQVSLEIAAWLESLRASDIQAIDLPRCVPETRPNHSPAHIEFLREYPQRGKHAPEAISSKILREIASAKRSIWISTPYFVTPVRVREALIAAAQRGVSVTILTNSLESTDRVIVHAAYTNLRRDLIRHGIQVLEKQGQDPLHAKLIVIDESKTILGSHNLDMLSMNRNSEVGLLVCCTGFAREAMVLFRSLANNSKCLNHVKLFRYEAREGTTPDEKIKQYQRLRWVAPWIRRYL